MNNHLKYHSKFLVWVSDEISMFHLNIIHKAYQQPNLEFQLPVQQIILLHNSSQWLTILIILAHGQNIWKI